MLPGISKKQTPYEHKCLGDLDESVKEVLGMTGKLFMTSSCNKIVNYFPFLNSYAYKWSCLGNSPNVNIKVQKIIYILILAIYNIHTFSECSLVDNVCILT